MIESQANTQSGDAEQARALTLYSYFRSSAAYRVRIALGLKGLPYDYVPIHLLRDGGQQRAPRYVELNPEALVPVLIEDEGDPLTQSLAIVEYLEETRPEPPLLPRAPADRAYVRSIAMQIACDIHPLDNLRVLFYLKKTLGVSDDQKNAWYRHWIETGFAALETRLAREAGPGGRVGRLCFGDTPTIADLCLVPQVFNAERMGVPLDVYPTIQRIAAAAGEIEAFVRAAPGNQVDAE
ncbi:maleylacetoacetate isomerase [Pararobbsia alpina]|nr:maleylacetoacetate isomerase [Pararobbsia alpina]